jgi:hypothetical protein
MARSEALVIRIEAVVEGLVENAIAGKMRLQDEILEKPSDVREMPFGGAGVVHGLDDHIFRA